jgi:hypothetical protein
MLGARATEKKASNAWLRKVDREMEAFAKKHELPLRSTDRELSAAFEIGCFHAVMKFYESQDYVLAPQALTELNEYRYLTSPSGNPANFSFVSISGRDGEFELRQQIRIESHLNEAIRFTPDLLVITGHAEISNLKNPDFANGKRSFFSVSSRNVVAAHECKSINPFPELLVSYIGMVVAGHAWYPSGQGVQFTKQEGHLGPTLFVGGTARALYLKMIDAMQKSFMMNIVCGLHEGTWSLTDAKNRLIWGDADMPLGFGDEIPF